jgi:hypothetical protein
VWFFSIPKIWTVIFYCAVILVPFWGRAEWRGDFLSFFTTTHGRWGGPQSAGMVNLRKEYEAKSVLYTTSLESGVGSGQYFISHS